MESHENRSTTRDVQFETDLMRPADADGVVKLFKAVYGDGYPIKLFYDAEAVIRANREGEYYTVVARTPDGTILGMHNLFRSAPFKGVYEWGVGLVLREYRGSGISMKVASHMSDVVIPMLPIAEAFGEAVCNHLIMQKATEYFRYIETAIAVALMPAAAYNKEKSASGRVAALLVFRCYEPKPHRVFLPRCYEKELGYIYASLDDRRDFALSDIDLPEDMPTEAEMTVFDFAQVARIAVWDIGSDIDRCISDLEIQAIAGNCVVIQVWLNLGRRAVGVAVDMLRGKGYFIGGALARWFDEDGLLLQKLLVPPDFDDIHLYSERAKNILEIVKQDWARTQR